MVNTMKTPQRPKWLAAALLSTALVSAGSLALVPGSALAVPAGGYAELVESVSPSVVFIEVSGKPVEAAADDAAPADNPIEEFMRRFGGQQMPRPGMPNSQQMHGVGSGFIISDEGLIVTNNHVVENAATVTVKMSDGRSFEASVVGTDPMTDIALLKVEADGPLPALRFGSSADMRPGDEVVAVGSPFGLGGTATSGIVSATSRNINAGPLDDFIQTDAAINRGNSGGPLFNADGEVIGVNTAIFSPDGGSVGIGFAVPSDVVQRIVADLEDDGQIARGWLGVQIRPMSDEVANVLGYDAPRGAVVEEVSEKSPAGQAGIKKGDIIMSFNGKDIAEMRDLPKAVAETTPETAATLVVLRKGKQVTLDLTVGNLAEREA